MTKAILLESINHLAGFRIEGHSGFGIYGNDIVCAAISTMSQSTSYGIQEIVKADANEEIFEGYHYFQLLPMNDPIKFMQAQVMLKTMAKVLEDIATQFPNNLEIEYQSIGGVE